MTHSICLDVNPLQPFPTTAGRINIANVQTLALFLDNYCYSSQRSQDLIRKRTLHRHCVNMVKKWPR